MTDYQAAVDLVTRYINEGAEVIKHTSTQIILGALTSIISHNIQRSKSRVKIEEGLCLQKQVIKSQNMVPIIRKPVRYYTKSQSANTRVNPEDGKTYELKDLIFHGIAGNLSAADSTFNNVFKIVSAHAAVGTSEIHEYMDMYDISWGAGKWAYNLVSINIEMENVVGGQNGYSLPDQVRDNTIWYVVTQIIPKYYGNRRPDASWCLPHRAIIPTQCPAGVDFNDFLGRLQAGYDAFNTPIPAPIPVQVPLKTAGWCKSVVNVRLDPSRKQPYIRQMQPGQGFWYNGTVPGERVGDTDIWLILEDGHYVWSGAITNHN